MVLCLASTAILAVDPWDGIKACNRTGSSGRVIDWRKLQPSWLQGVLRTVTSRNTKILEKNCFDLHPQESSSLLEAE